MFRVLSTTLALIALLLMGCSATMPGPGGVTPGFLVNSTVTPASLASYDQRYTAFPDSFEIVGEIQGTSSNANVLGIFSFGNGGYLSALQDALSNSGSDGIINCSADISSMGFLALFSSSKTTVKGLGIKLKNK